jgi:hypothetical protein
VIQGSPEWLQARCGKPTASEYAAILAKGRGDTRNAYLRRVVAERITGTPTEAYSNAHMARGKEYEPLARMAYEAATGNIVEEAGFINHPTLQTGCSPDGLVDQDGGTEIKSVIPSVQIATILDGGYPAEHHAQVQGCLWITRRIWWDFISFSPDLPEHLQLYVYRALPDTDYIERLSIEVSRFIKEADTIYQLLMEKTP